VAGVAIGLAGALGATKLVESLLFGVRAWDPLTFAAAAGILLLVALGACYLPARGAARVDPSGAVEWEQRALGNSADQQRGQSVEADERPQVCGKIGGSPALQSVSATFP